MMKPRPPLKNEIIFSLKNIKKLFQISSFVLGGGGQLFFSFFLEKDNLSAGHLPKLNSFN